MKPWHAGLAGPLLVMALGIVLAAWVDGRLADGQREQREQRLASTTETCWTRCWSACAPMNSACAGPVAP